MLIIGLSLFPKSQLHSQLHCIFSSAKWTFFKINAVCKAIDVDTRCEIVIKTRKKSANNRSFSILQEPTTQYFIKCKYCAVGSWEIVKELLLALVFYVFLK